jgi:hypothetical protein
MRRLTVFLPSLLVLALVFALALQATGPVVAQEPSDTNVTVVEISLGEDGERVSDLERERVETAILRRLSGVSGYNGTIERSDGGLVLRLRPAAPPRVIDRLLQRGNFSFVARTPNATGVEVLSNEDVDRVGASRVQSGTPFVPIQLTDSGVREFSATLQQLNVTDNPSACDSTNRTGYCLIVQLDGSALNAAGVTPPLAAAIESGEFNQTGSFFLTTPERSQVDRLRLALATEPLPVSATASSVRNVSSTEPTATTTTTATATATITATETAATTATAGSNDTRTTGSSGASGPGFTPAAVVTALLALALGPFARQRARN